MAYKKKYDASTKDQSEFVTLAITDDVELACEYKRVLKQNDIPASIRKERDIYDNSLKVYVAVPEDCLDEAHIVVEAQADYGEFYDFETEDEDADVRDLEESSYEDDDDI